MAKIPALGVWYTPILVFSQKLVSIPVKIKTCQQSSVVALTVATSSKFIRQGEPVRRSDERLHSTKFRDKMICWQLSATHFVPLLLVCTCGVLSRKKTKLRRDTSRSAPTPWNALSFKSFVCLVYEASWLTFGCMFRISFFQSINKLGSQCRVQIYYMHGI